MELEECCRGLESTKITDRSKNIKQILFLLQNPETLVKINAKKTCTWDHIIFSTYLCLMKDADKYVEDMRKKNSSTVPCESNGRIFFDVVAVAIKESTDLDFSKLLEYVKSFLERKTMTELYGKSCFITLKDHILLCPRFRSHLEGADWSHLLAVLKKMCGNPQALSKSNYIEAECLGLVIKWGPLYRLPAEALREEFPFAIEISKSVRPSSLRSHKEIILNLVLEFCRHTARDNRLACCKLGEELLPYFLELYEINVREDQLKVQLIDFFLLQIVLHHPKGAREGHHAAFAHDRGNWNRYLRSIYSSFCEEITFNMRCKNKNSVLFVGKDGRQELLEYLVDLFVEVCRQVLNKVDGDVTAATTCALSSDVQQAKRAKSDTSVCSLINKAVDTKNWPWVQIIYSLLEAYPDMFSEEDFVLLLQSLSCLQKECHDKDFRYHTYKCLAVMLDAETSLFRSPVDPRTSKMWSTIGETTLKEVGLKQSAVAEGLLQKLISRDVFQSQQILKIFNTSASFTLCHVKSLNLYGQHFNFPKSDGDGLKSDLIALILDSENAKRTPNCFAVKLTAKVLVNLVLKHWTLDETSREESASQVKKRPYDDISDIYFKTCFEDVLLLKPVRSRERAESPVPMVNESLKSFLCDALINLATNMKDSYKDDLEALLNVTILIKNVIDQMSLYKIQACEVPRLLDMLRSLFHQFAEKFADFSKLNREETVKKLISCLDLIVIFLTDVGDVSTIDTIVSLVPFDLLKVFFKILNSNTNKRHVSSADLKCKLTLKTMQVISLYCFISGTGGTTDTQFHAFETIADFAYDIDQEFDYTLAKTFLDAFRFCKIGSLGENCVQKLLEFITNICSVRYSLYESAVEMLETLKLVLRHLKANFSESHVKYITNLLEPFHTRTSNYGPKVSVLIIECCDILCQIDVEYGRFRKWINNDLAIVTVCKFLCSDYQEVRFASIVGITRFFAVENIDVCNIQKDAFKLIFQLSLEVFEIQGSVSNERRIDETITRTASVLQTFAGLALANPIWLQESVFCLLRITHMKKLNAADKIVSVVSGNLGVTEQNRLLEQYLEYILDRWRSFSYSIDEFPFELFGCDSKMKFCKKYPRQIAFHLVENDRDTINRIAEEKNQNVVDLLRDCLPKIFADCLRSEASNGLGNLNCNRTLSYLNEKIGIESFKLTIKDNLHSLISELLQSVLDDGDFEHRFGSPPIFPIFYGDSLTFAQLENCLRYLESSICDVQDVLGYLIKNEPNKIHKITLQLKFKLDQTKTDKLKIFHSYFIIVSLLTARLNSKLPFCEYFIRDTVHYFLNMVENYASDPNLAVIACKAFQSFIRQILPDYSNIVLSFFHTIVNKLTSLSVRFDEISDCCLNTLNAMIMEHFEQFASSIENLDPFPSDGKFRELQGVYCHVRRKTQNTSLEKDVEYFVRCGHETSLSDFREEGLRHLRERLSESGEELRSLYSKLKDVRGFSEDCANSLLHQLTCMLVKLTGSKQTNVALEACKCLGELGPMNLFTLILEPEKAERLEYLTPFEILCGQILSCLLSYTIDPDVNLLLAVTEALGQVLSSKEGIKMAKCNEEFLRGKINYNYLVPFIVNSKHKMSNRVCLDENALLVDLNSDTLWSPHDNVSHDDWIKQLVSSILGTFTSKSFLPKLIPVCKLKSEFCEEILPYLVYLIISTTRKNLNEFVVGRIGYFFEQHWKKTVLERARNVEVIVLNKSSIKCMLNTVHYIRLQTNKIVTQKPTRDSLNLNYLHLAQAAQYCMQHFSAILYSELWCHENFQQTNDRLTRLRREEISNSKMLDVIYENVDDQTGRALEEILRGSYKTLGEFDALHGCGTSLFLNPGRRIKHYKDLGRWDQALLHHEIEVANDKPAAMRNLIDSFKHCSLYKLPTLYNQSEEYEYECLWRLGQWDIEEQRKNNCNGNGNNDGQFEKLRYFALKYLHDNDLFHLSVVIKEARLLEIETLQHTSLESCRNLYGILTKLQSLNEIETFAKIKDSAKDVDDFLIKRKFQDSVANNDFEYNEPLISQRIVMMKSKLDTSDAKDNLVDSILNLAKYARIENRLSIATRAIRNLWFYENLSDRSKYKIQLEDAQLCWRLEDKTGAHHILKQLYSNETTDPRIRSYALKLAGQWLTETLSENKNTIMTNYLLASLDIYNNLDRTNEDVNNIHDTYDQLARFADKQYQHILSCMNSEAFQQKIKNMRKLRQAASDIKSTGKKLTREETRAVHFHEQQSAIDKTEIENAEKEKDLLLSFALKYYLLNLTKSDKNNIRIFRVMSLFFENRMSPVITDIVNKYLPEMPSYKYITILPQIVPHISNTSDNLFVEHVNKIIYKCAVEHPHQTLPLILSLVYSDKDRDYSKTTTNTAVNDARISSASALVNNLKRNNKPLGDVITKMEFLSEALIQLAYYKAIPTKEDQVEFSIPHSYRIKKVKSYANVLLPTFTLDVDKSSTYKNLIGIHSFGDTYRNVGGINAPKRITCRGTDGKLRLQLLKGQDDLRQDAVMQQVFTILNGLLFANKTTKDLIIRTYKVVPLSMRSGILEWVDNSMPLGEYLVGDGKNKAGAHVTYRPQDKSPRECRSLLMSCSTATVKEKLKVYSTICQSFKPVFHKFFEHSFPQPSVWYERRRAYIYSVATTSMCGYILGIGDRHVQNILVDKSTAEVIHIDFGIAFEQGRLLPTPETVPFRLSRDVVDGMGVCGVEGVFRKSCEKTMEVMRQNSQTILTILQVLLYDPLYTWAVTSAEANKRQKNGQDDSDTEFEDSSSTEEVAVNITAERALMRCKSKLHGIEDGYSTSLEHQVGTLIQQAQDPANLCRLFRGWQAYL